MYYHYYEYPYWHNVHGLELWKYYHKKEDAKNDASYYEIREYFQGRNEKGRMNNSSKDEIYTELISKLRESLKVLAKEIAPRIYEFGILKK